MRMVWNPEETSVYGVIPKNLESEDEIQSMSVKAHMRKVAPPYMIWQSPYLSF